ncbi:hypothetical protein BT96DRAFT_188419 [Gymnopus androsaceus JB14]|uniref:Uncharacterized protein n=1 Tax=Gymnopus androsaceus JB14 TaxID=1447944 RepID=A0A6A4H9X0_9AGAR|nr:hypothetical protein BT96DRAFT_188419 [Gymnopus androsaceus JB14]
MVMVTPDTLIRDMRVRVLVFQPRSSERDRETKQHHAHSRHRPHNEIIPASASASEETHFYASQIQEGEGEDSSEIRQIQQRKRDVIGRYEARKEYLRARLRGAELHERVVKGR